VEDAEYFQDNFRLNETKLTLTLGIRYEIYAPPWTRIMFAHTGLKPDASGA